MSNKFAENLEAFFNSSSSDRAFKDVLEKLTTSVKEPSGALADKFIRRFTPESSSNNPFDFKEFIHYIIEKDPIPFECDTDEPCLIAAFIFLFAFYAPYSRNESVARFPDVCDYEIHIPFGQTDKNWTTFIVLPAGVQIGDTVPFLKGYIFHGSCTETFGITPTPVSQLNQIDGRKSYSFLTKMIEKEAIIRKDIGEQGAFTSGMMTVNDLEVLRLPCYNIPFQCAFEMIIGTVGDFVKDSFSLLQDAVENNKYEIILRRKPLNSTMFHAALLWPAWELGKLSEAERLSHLINVLAAGGLPCIYSPNQHESLRVQCHRMFENHRRAKTLSTRAI